MLRFRELYFLLINIKSWAANKFHHVSSSVSIIRNVFISICLYSFCPAKLKAAQYDIINLFISESLFVKIAAKAAEVQNFLFLSAKNFYHTSSERMIWLSMICLHSIWRLISLHLCGSNRWFTGHAEIHVADFMLFCLRRKVFQTWLTWDSLVSTFYMLCNCTRHRTSVVLCEHCIRAKKKEARLAQLAPVIKT